MTKIEIIQETAAYYGEDPSRRGLFLDSNSVGDPLTKCAYITKDGKMCAVGRCLIDPGVISYDTSIYSALNDKELEQEDFKEPYRGHDADFWTDVQDLHDSALNWDGTGLTKKGKDILEYLLTKYHGR